ncbi:MEKHLA domain-containing protein [Streptomyces sp. 049-1]|uniref:MEKHLA domain-containing protein n=1 Tax=Streptomyces sp. 049-1 TaxID=2789264 RepID=UPI003980FEC0
MSLPPFQQDTAFAALLADSHQRLTGTPLVPHGVAQGEVARWLFEEAHFPVLAQDTSEDPVFVYANVQAQSCFGYTQEEFSGLPSRLSAPSRFRAGRERLMTDVRTKGYTRGYRGLRRHKSGRQFWIEDVTIWNLVDARGVLRGQAAAIHSYADE